MSTEGSVKSRQRAVVALDVESDVSVGTALEHDLAVSARQFEDPREDAQELLRGTRRKVQRRATVTLAGSS